MWWNLQSLSLKIQCVEEVKDVYISQHGSNFNNSILVWAHKSLFGSAFILKTVYMD